MQNKSKTTKRGPFNNLFFITCTMLWNDLLDGEYFSSKSSWAILQITSFSIPSKKIIFYFEKFKLFCFIISCMIILILFQADDFSFKFQKQWHLGSFKSLRHFENDWYHVKNINEISSLRLFNFYPDWRKTVWSQNLRICLEEAQFSLAILLW